MSEILFIDVETCECRDPDYIQSVRVNIRPPASIKKPESMVKWYKEKSEDAVQAVISKTSFDGLHGEIISIAWAVNDGEVKSLSRDVDGCSEWDLLTDFFVKLYTEHKSYFNPTWCAHNIDFDFRFLFLRCVVLGVIPLYKIPHNAKPWSRDVYCTLYETMGMVKAGGSLDAIARAFKVGQKTDGIDGSKVNQFWLDGRIDEIESYNRDDVHLCREIYKKLNFVKTVSDLQNEV